MAISRYSKKTLLVILILNAARIRNKVVSQNLMSNLCNYNLRVKPLFSNALHLQTVLKILKAGKCRIGSGKQVNFYFIMFDYFAVKIFIILKIFIMLAPQIPKNIISVL